MIKAFERDKNLQFFFKTKERYLLTLSGGLFVIEILIWYRSHNNGVSADKAVYLIFLVPIFVILFFKLRDKF